MLEYNTLVTEHQPGTQLAKYEPRTVWLIFVATLITILGLLLGWFAFAVAFFDAKRIPTTNGPPPGLAMM